MLFKQYLIEVAADVVKPRRAQGGVSQRTGQLGRWFSQPINAKQSSFRCFHLTFGAAISLLFFSPPN
jgi:hypothetical protein